MEEFVLEKIFFPDSRGSIFRGYSINLIRKLPLLMLFVGTKLAWDATIKDRQLVQLSAMMNESQLQALKAQINPHFLFNSLNNLYSFALNKSALTPKIILGLSGILRYMIYECKEEFVPLEVDLKALSQFVDLQKLQIEDRGQVTYEVKGEAGKLKVAPLLFLAFVENSFKHSTSSQSEDIKIDIQLVIIGENIKMTCYNSHDLQSNNERLDSGVGLYNVKKRLELLYPDKYSLKITDDEVSYQVDLSLDLS